MKVDEGGCVPDVPVRLYSIRSHYTTLNNAEGGAECRVGRCEWGRFYLKQAQPSLQYLVPYLVLSLHDNGTSAIRGSMVDCAVEAPSVRITLGSEDTALSTAAFTKYMYPTDRPITSPPMS